MPKLIQNNEFISGSSIMDATPQPNSTHTVQSGGVYTAFNNLSTEISAINSRIDNLIKEDTLNITLSSQEFISNINIDNRKILMVYIRGVGAHIKYRISSGGAYVFQLTNKDNGEIITSGSYVLSYYYV